MSALLAAALAVALSTGAPLPGAGSRSTRSAERAASLVGSIRKPLAVVLAVPESGAALGRSELLSRLDRVLAARTDLAVELLQDTSADECRGALACLAGRVGAGPSGAARWMLILSLVPVPGSPARVFATFVDVDRAQEEERRADKSLPGWEDELEVRLSEHAVVGRLRDVEVPGADHLERRLDELFARDLRAALEAVGSFAPFGAVDLDVGPGVTVAIDGVIAGLTGPGTTRVDEVRAGRRVLRFEAEACDPVEQVLEVEAGEVARVSLELEPRSAPGREALLWVGAGTAAAGASILVYALARHDPAARTACFAGTAGCEAGSAFETTGYDGGGGLAAGANPAGLLVAPLGAALLLAGGAWISGSRLGTGDGVPWVELGVGLALGALTYGIAAAIDTPTP